MYVTAEPASATPIPLDASPDVHSLSSEYRSYGWWVEDDPTSGNSSLVVGGVVNALLMSAELGARVNRTLSIHLLAGPVIGYQDEETWAFLTEPADSGAQLPNRVAGQVTAVRPGRRLLLPTSKSPFGAIRWINEPGSSCPKPPWQAVVSATRRVVEASVAQMV